jgi:orotate phosphoribosyltransferase
MTTLNRVPALAQAMVASGVVQVNLTKPAILSSGLWVPIHINFEEIETNVKLRGLVVSCLVEIVAEIVRTGKCVLVATQKRTIPLSAIVADRLGLEHFTIRDDFEDIGSLEGKSVVLLQDLIHTGRTLTNLYDRFVQSGILVRNSIALFSYKNNPFGKKSEILRSGVYILLTLINLQPHLLEANIVTDEGWDEILRWLADPQGWSNEFRKRSGEDILL